MANFRGKTFQLKTFSSSTEKLFDFNCIAPKNQLKICVDSAEYRTENHNKAFVMLLKVNSSAIYAVLVNKCKVKYFKKQECQISKILLRKDCFRPLG